MVGGDRWNFLWAKKSSNRLGNRKSLGQKNAMGSINFGLGGFIGLRIGGFLTSELTKARRNSQGPRKSENPRGEGFKAWQERKKEKDAFLVLREPHEGG